MKNTNSSRGLAIASMVLGILGIVLSFCMGFGIILAIPGLIISIVALIKKQGGMAIAGLILSIIALAISCFTSFIIFKPADTTQTTNQPGSAITPKATETRDKNNQKTEYGIGDHVEIKNKKGDVLYTITITNISKNNYRNPYADSTVSEVIDIEYTYENINNTTDLLVSYFTFKVYDSNNTICSIYPSPSDKVAQTIPKGSNCTAIVSYGLPAESNKIKIDYNDFANPYAYATTTWVINI